MPRLTIDAKDAQSRKALPDDTYTCRVESISDVKKGAKARYVEAQYKVIEGEFEGRIIFQNLPVEGKGAGIFVDMWNVTTDANLDVDDLESFDADTDDAVGCTLGVVTRQREYPEGSGEFKHEVHKLVQANT